MTPKIAALKAALRPHGTRARYVQQCRCEECRAANTSYQRKRAAAIARGEGNPMVSADAARAHIAALRKDGVGRRTAAGAAGVSDSLIYDIARGEKRKIRLSTERRILAVSAEDRADGALVAAGPTWRRIERLVKRGYPKATLARLFGYQAPALQLKRGRIRAANAFRIARLCDAIEAGELRRD